MFPRRLRSIAITATATATVTAMAVGGGAVSAMPGNGSDATAGASLAAPSGRGAPGGRGFDGRFGPRSGPAAGGAVGKVDSVSASSFAISTSAGRMVTVEMASSTTYRNETGSTSASAITTGESVLVVGTVNFGPVNGPTIIASQVILRPAEGGGSAASSAGDVAPFQRGASSTSRQVGEIPADYTQGRGTIVGGVEANQATEAALAAYPGGIVNRVVKLSGGEYEVHHIGVNWPHHVFVDHEFKVVGAD